jgi:hypothetical protein
LLPSLQSGRTLRFARFPAVRVVWIRAMLKGVAVLIVDERAGVDDCPDLLLGGVTK